MQIDVSSPDIGATLRDIVMAKVKANIQGLKRSELSHDERAVASFLVQDGKIRKEVVDPKTYTVVYFPDVNPAS